MSIARPFSVETVMTARDADLGTWLSVIKGEYQEMPGLQLTKPQVRRLWALEPSTCDVLLATLQATHFLRLTPEGFYVRADSVSDRRRRVVPRYF